METEGYRTKILNIAAFLYAKGLELIYAQRVKGEVIFIFSPTKEAIDLVEQYFAGTAVVNPRELFARLNDLRDLINSEQKNGKEV